MQLRVLADFACHTGEGPLWHPEESAVYWTDIPAGKLYRLNWPDGESHQVYTGVPVGGMTLQADGSVALFCAGGQIQIMRPDGYRILVDGLPGEEGTRFNDVIADPRGRVFAGTMSSENRRGRLYRIDPDLTVTTVLEDVGCSNGLGFNADRTRLYHIDTSEREVSVCEYDEESGEIGRRRRFVRTDGVPGYPDGMTVDADDHVWVAFWDGSCLVRYDPEGAEVLRVPFEVRKVSCLTFGGRDYGDIFVTTAGGHQKSEDGHDAGALFYADLPYRGRAEFRSRLGL